MIGIEFLKGQGLGNQLFCYAALRGIAEKNGYRFGTAGRENFAVNIHSDKGMYFMDMDLGEEIGSDMKSSMETYQEKEVRLYIGNSLHDIENGCYIAGSDEKITGISDNTLMYGNMQAESYFEEYKDKLGDWFKVKEEYENYDYSSEDICVINMRGGEYTGSPELHLRKKYWKDAMKYMRSINANMRFVIITDDIEAARRMFPKIETHHFDLAGDYVTIKNAHYLILSNSSFACIPAFTSKTLKYAIAPKYWARHNVSDGYWASEQNIYSIFTYMDRKGKIYTPEECKNELKAYMKRMESSLFIDRKPDDRIVRRMKIKAGFIYKKAYILKRAGNLKRKIVGA